MERIKLLEILHGDISQIDTVNLHEVAPYDVEIIINPVDVKNILRSFLVGKLSSNDLQKWATFICSRAEFICPNAENDVWADYYEDMMYVIQRLSTPEIDGDITIERIKQYLEELKKYNDK